MALGTIIAAAIAYENAMTARRGTATYAFDQAVLIGEGAEALAAYGLREIAQSNAKEIYVGQGWDKPLGPVEVVPGVMLEASLEDLQGRFNLNNLVTHVRHAGSSCSVAAFTQLLELVGLEPKWTGYIVDWIDHERSAEHSRGRGGQRLHGADPALSHAQPLHHEHQRAAGAAGIRARPLPEARALHHGAAARHEAQRLHRLRGGARRLPAPARASSAPTRRALAKNRAECRCVLSEAQRLRGCVQNDPTHWTGAGQPPAAGSSGQLAVAPARSRQPGRPRGYRARWG